MARNDLPDVHPVALLLPWYVTGTLSEHERQEVDRHLATCPDCQTELEDLRMLAGQVRAANLESAVPDTFRATLARIRESERPRQTRVLEVARNGLRALFSPTWVPAAVLALILVQSGMLVWMSQRSTAGGEISSRGLQSPATRLTLVFRPTATERDIRLLLLEAHAHLMSGPSKEGAYIVEIPTTDAARIEQRLATLRGRHDVVQSADRTP